MTNLVHLATRSFIQTRLTVTTGYRKAFATVTGVKGEIQPLSPEKTAFFEGKVGKTYILFIDGNIPVQEKDKFRDTYTNEEYEVKVGGVNRRAHGCMDFLEVIVVLIG